MRPLVGDNQQDSHDRTVGAIIALPQVTVLSKLRLSDSNNTVAYGCLATVSNPFPGLVGGPQLDRPRSTNTPASPGFACSEIAELASMAMTV